MRFSIEVLWVCSPTQRLPLSVCLRQRLVDAPPLPPLLWLKAVPMMRCWFLTRLNCFVNILIGTERHQAALSSLLTEGGMTLHSSFLHEVPLNNKWSALDYSFCHHFALCVISCKITQKHPDTLPEDNWIIILICLWHSFWKGLEKPKSLSSVQLYNNYYL